VEPTAFLPELELIAANSASAMALAALLRRAGRCFVFTFFELFTHAEALRSLLLRGLQWCGIQLASAIFFLP
jgi:hypothetical protein